MIEEHKLKAFLKALKEQSHWNAVVARGAAEAAGLDMAGPIGTINDSYAKMSDLLDEAIYDEVESDEGYS